MEPKMIVKKHRLEKGWSQEHLAQLSGLSVRTIQRIERGNTIGLESMKCLAAVFEIDVANLMQEQPMENHHDAETGIEYANNKKAFWLNLIAFILIMPVLFYVNKSTSPDFLWVKWVGLFWGLSFLLHGATMFLGFGRK